MKPLHFAIKTLGLLLLFLTIQVNTAQAQTYSVGEKVEVRIEGKWMVGTYEADNSHYSNMKDTPHNVSYKTALGGGRKNVSSNDIRKFTGTIVMVKKPEGPKVSQVNHRELSNEIIEEINYMRTQPQAYAKKLAKLKSKYVKVDDKYWYLDFLGQDGKLVARSDSERAQHEKWLDEVIAELNKAKPMTRLTKNNKLVQCAELMAKDRGGFEHTDSQGRSPQDRAKVVGYNNHVEENLYGGTTAFGIVAGYLIDYNVQSRGHRKSLMREQAREIGVFNNARVGETSFKNVVVISYGQKK